MKKIKDFLKAINKIVKLPEIDGWVAASDLNDVEISDEAATELSESIKGLLTEDAAKNNAGLKNHFKQQLYDSIKGELLGNVDTQLHTTVRDVFGDEALGRIEENEFTKDKIRTLHDIILEHQTKKADDKTKLMVDGLKKQLEKNEAAYKKKEEQLISEKKKLIDGYAEKLTHAEISRRIGSKQFAEKYNEDDMKSILMQTAIQRINGEAVIKMNDKGELATYSKESPEMEYFVDGVHLSVDDLINKHIGKYLAKSEPVTTKKDLPLPAKRDDSKLYQSPQISSLGKGIATGH